MSGVANLTGPGWIWIDRLSDRYKFNAIQQKALRENFILSHRRTISKPPYIVDSNNPITILIWNTTNFESLIDNPKWANSCGVPCKVTSDRNYSRDAHMVLTTNIEMSETSSQLQPYQQKALVLFKPDLSMTNGTYQTGGYHMLISYSKHSDIRIDYSRSIVIPHGRPILGKKTKKALAAAFISNCRSNDDAHYRLNYLRELKAHLPIDSYGSCLRTPGLRTNFSFTEVASRYHYVLIFEDLILDDYVTDKFYQALSTDAIPVYLGAPNVAEYLPDQHNHHIIIEARNFPNPEVLSTYLKELAKNETDYMKYFDWRNNIIDSAFSKQFDFEQLGKNSLVCRMCRSYSSRLEK